jgi:hypothetical protein
MVLAGRKWRAASIRRHGQGVAKSKIEVVTATHAQKKIVDYMDWT